MSDTPKYSYWHLSENERRRLEMERRAEEIRLENLRREAAEIKRKQRLASFQNSLREQIQALEMRVQNLEREFLEENFSGIERLGDWEKLSSEWKEEVGAAEWDEDAQRVQKKIRIREGLVDDLAEMLRIKRRLIRQIEEMRLKIEERGGLQVLQAPPIGDSEFNELIRNIRETQVLDHLKGMESSWKRAAEEFHAQCLFFDQKQRFYKMEKAMKAFDRKLLIGENQNLFQQLSDAMDQLRIKIGCVRMKEVSAAFLPVENYFSALSSRLQQSVAVLAKRREENGRIWEEFDAEWKRESGNWYSEQSTVSDERTNIWKTVENLKLKIESQLEALRQQMERLAPAQFNQAIERLRNEMKVFREQRESIRQLETLGEWQEMNLPKFLWENFAPDEWREFERGRSVLFRQIQNRQSINFKKDFEAHQAFLNECFERRKTSIQSWTIQHGAIKKGIADLREYWSFWFSDPSVRQWAEIELAAQETELQEILKMMDERVFDLRLVEERVAAWKKMMEQIVQAVLEVQQRERKRQYLVRRFEEEFRKLGFSLSEPQLEDPGNPASGIVLSAARRGEGRTINVRFDQEESEPVLYAVDGFPMPRQKVDGNDFRTCDEAQRQLTILHQLLEKHGIVMGKVQWEDQPPTDLAKEAMELPDAVFQSRVSDG